jgi:aldehyde dehydrogenase
VISTAGLDAVEPVEARMLIAGEWIDTPQVVPVISPADTRVRIGSVPIASEAHVRAAVRSAADAFPVWSATPLPERAERLRAAASALRAGEEPRARLLAMENGQTIAEARAGVRGCSRTLDYYADMAESFAIEEELPSPTGRVVVRRDPMGVAVLVVPWNAPTRLGFLGLAPILLAGNTVVVKPPSDAPLALIDALAVVAPLFPPGTIGIVTGRGDRVGKALVGDPLVRRINFTGSTEAGKEIARVASGTLKRLSLELGGNDPAIVLADADLDLAVPELVRGVYALAGQMCYDVKRIYVDQAIAPEFSERFLARAGELVVGDGLDERVGMGPMISEGQRTRLNRMLDEASASGATVQTVGQRLDEDAWERGHFQLPAVVTGADDRSRIVSEEQFGPAVPIMWFASVDEAVGRANASSYGLAASVWSRDEERAFGIAARLEAGTSFVNVHRLGASGDDMPFGGFKESGVGRSHGVVALEEQFELHTLSSRRAPG